MLCVTLCRSIRLRQIGGCALQPSRPIIRLHPIEAVSNSKSLDHLCPCISYHVISYHVISYHLCLSLVVRLWIGLCVLGLLTVCWPMWLCVSCVFVVCLGSDGVWLCIAVQDQIADIEAVRGCVLSLFGTLGLCCLSLLSFSLPSVCWLLSDMCQTVLAHDTATISKSCQRHSGSRLWKEETKGGRMCGKSCRDRLYRAMMNLHWCCNVTSPYYWISTICQQLQSTTK